MTVPLVLLTSVLFVNTAATHFSQISCVTPNVTDGSAQCPSEANRLVTLNGLINYKSNIRGSVFKSNENVIFLSGIGMSQMASFQCFLSIISKTFI